MVLTTIKQTNKQTQMRLDKQDRQSLFTSRYIVIACYRLCEKITLSCKTNDRETNYLLCNATEEHIAHMLPPLEVPVLCNAFQFYFRARIV